jgi:hypothetical protein
MDAGSTVSVYVNTSATVTGLTQDPVAGTWSFTVNDMIEGTNNVQISVADAVGNTRTIQLSIVVDLTGPVTTIKQYPLTAQAGTFTFAGTVSEAASSVFVEVYDSSVSPNLVASGDASVDADIWDVTLDLSLQPDDTYSVVATGTDRLNNDSATPAEQEIMINSASPAFSIVNPATFPVVLADPTNVSQVFFDGTRSSDATLVVTKTSGILGTVNYPDLLTWDTNISSLAAGKTVVTFDVDTGGTIQKFLVVRDLTAPTIVEWSSPAPDEITVLFNETMSIDPDPLISTIGIENLTVVDATGTVVPVNSVTASVDLKTVTFVTDPFLASETYTATLQTTETYLVEDGRGNSIAASYSWIFKK